MKLQYHKSVTQAVHYDDKSQLINELKELTQLDDKILIKGSRGMKLEEVVDALV